MTAIFSGSTDRDGDFWGAFRSWCHDSRIAWLRRRAGSGACVGVCGLRFGADVGFKRDETSGRPRAHSPEGRREHGCEQRLVGTGRGEGDADSGRAFDDARSHLDQTPPIVPNSARFNSDVSGMASRVARSIQQATVCSVSLTWLARAEVQDVRSLASCVLWSLIRFSAGPLRQCTSSCRFGRGAGQRRDDEPDVRPSERARLDAGDDVAPDAARGAGGVPDLAMRPVIALPAVLF